MHSFQFLQWIKFCSGCFRQFFFSIWGTKKVITCPARQVVVLYSNDCMRISLCRLSIGHLRQWLSYRGGHLNRFDCNKNRKHPGTDP